MACIVSRQGDPQRRLAVGRVVAGGTIAGAEHHGRCREIATGVESRLNREAQPGQISAVDLGEPEIEIGPAREKLASQPRRLLRIARTHRGTGSVIDADRQGVEAALGVGNGRQGLRRHSRRTGLGESEDGGEVEHWDWFREGPIPSRPGFPHDPQSPHVRFPEPDAWMREDRASGVEAAAPGGPARGREASHGLHAGADP